MKRLHQYQEEAEATLNSLEGLQPVGTDSFFYTRLMARMESTPPNFWAKAAYFLAQPAVSLSILIFFLLLNGFLIFSDGPETEEAQPQDYVAQQISYFDNLNNP
jgi:hypothetical protein